MSGLSFVATLGFDRAGKPAKADRRKEPTWPPRSRSAEAELAGAQPSCRSTATIRTPRCSRAAPAVRHSAQEISSRTCPRAAAAAAALTRRLRNAPMSRPSCLAKPFGASGPDTSLSNPAEIEGSGNSRAQVGVLEHGDHAKRVRRQRLRQIDRLRLEERPIDRLRPRRQQREQGWREDTGSSGEGCRTIGRAAAQGGEGKKRREGSS